ncbi:MAG: hypothetical protein JWO67_4119 [Streptosporangiaceae bacterium]|nr:hypothetical protein [Streptosporangiaceae bacterium]
MYNPQNTQIARERTTHPHVIPVGSSGLVTPVTDGTHTYLICRTVRGRGSWGVHTEGGTLLVSGWPTRNRAQSYAERLISRAAAPAGGA